jgi:hypothetical protein
MQVQHKAERGGDVDGWDLALAIHCPKKQHGRLQELVVLNLAKDRLPNRRPAWADLGKGVESGECWDFGVYMAE